MGEPEEGEGENLKPKAGGLDDSGDIRKLAVADLDLQPEPESDALGIEEEMVERVMKWLEMEIASTSPSLSFSSSSSASASSFLQDTEWVTINGNEETCGSSFSGTASTVMASIDTRYEAPYLGSVWPFAGGELAPTEEDVVARGEYDQGSEKGVVDAADDDDDELLEFFFPDDFADIAQS